MKEVLGNIWDYPADCICITTNGSVRNDGCAVMGRGVALQAKHRVPGIDFKIGAAIRTRGNHLYMMGDYCTFPVKHRWQEMADLELIKQSTQELDLLARQQFPGYIFVLPRPGCGNGQRTWEEVKPIVSILPDNVHIICLPAGLARNPIT